MYSLSCSVPIKTFQNDDNYLILIDFDQNNFSIVIVQGPLKHLSLPINGFSKSIELLRKLKLLSTHHKNNILLINSVLIILIYIENNNTIN